MKKIRYTLSCFVFAALVFLSSASSASARILIWDDGAAQGLRLPNVGATPSDITGANEGYLAYDEAEGGVRMAVLTGGKG